MTASIEVWSGPGCFTIDDWRDLWQAMFCVLAYAIAFEALGACTCGCTVADCDYCAHECGPDVVERLARSR